MSSSSEAGIHVVCSAGVNVVFLDWSKCRLLASFKFITSKLKLYAFNPLSHFFWIKEFISLLVLHPNCFYADSAKKMFHMKKTFTLKFHQFYCLGTSCSIWGLSQREDTSRLLWNRFQGVPCQPYSGNLPPPPQVPGGSLSALLK